MSKSITKIVLKVFFLLIAFYNNCYTDTNLTNEFSLEKSKISIGLNLGMQISGIKDEDFKFSNLSPFINLVFSYSISGHSDLKVGYKGFYFKYILDDINHKYHFIYISFSLNILDYFCTTFLENRFNSKFYLGSGIFHNYHKDKTQFCIDIGGQLNYQLVKNLFLNFDISSIAGWKIYQDNYDILPALSIGLTKKI